MKKNKLQESLDKMKRLTEFHFKPHTRQDSIVPTENPVSFDEVGDIYKHEQPKPEVEENDYPTFEQYRDEVIIDEDDPEGQDEPVPAEQPQAQPEQPAPAPEPAEQPVSQVPPAPTPEPAPVEPAPAPVEPAPAPQPTVNDNSEMEGMFANFLAKQDELLNKIGELEGQLSGVQNVAAKIDSVAKEVNDIKNPSYDAQHDLISQQSFPYNVKLSDFWGWDKEEESEPQPENFTVTPEEINSYNKEEIKNSFK